MIVLALSASLFATLTMTAVCLLHRIEPVARGPRLRIL